MSVSLMPEPRQRYYNNDGTVAAGCYLYTYAAGTSTPKATYQDSAGATPHANPIVLDAKGEAVIYWTGNYKIDLKTASDVQITGFPIDNYQSLSTATEAAQSYLATVAGTPDVITAIATPPITAYSAGQTFRFIASGTNTTNVTININGLGAVAVTKNGSTALVAGDIPSGSMNEIVHDGTRFQLNGVVADRALTTSTITNQIMIVRDEKASNTNGGGSTAFATTTRTLNTTAVNTITGASLASNQITLPAGTYRIRASAPAFVNHQARLYNVTDAATTIVGTSENATVSGAVDAVGVRSFVIGRFTIASTKVFELRDYTVETRATDGLGGQVNSGANEVYSEVEIIREV